VEVWLFTFVGALRDHLCDSTAFLFYPRSKRKATGAISTAVVADVVHDSH